MTIRGSTLLMLIGATSLGVACVTSPPDDPTPLPPLKSDAGKNPSPSKDSGVKAMGKVADAGRASTEPEDESEDDSDGDSEEVPVEPGGARDAGGAGSTGGAVGTGDAGATPMADAGPPKPAGSKIKGSALPAKCTLLTPAKGGKCSGYYCGVTLEQVAAEFTGLVSKCDHFTPEQVCDNPLQTAVSDCAYSVTAANPLASAEMIREKTRDCVEGKEPRLSQIPECVDCYLDAADCGIEKCILECSIATDSPDCESCRLKNNCNQPVAGCMELPDPF